MRYQMRRRGPWWLSEEPYGTAEGPMARRGAWPRGWGEQAESRAWAPATDMLDRGDRLVLKVELPGVPQENIDVTLEKNVLTIRGEREAEEADENEWLCCERPAGSFYRAIQIPAEVDAGDVTADYKHGVLTIVLPKQEEEHTRKIAVKGEQA